MYNSYPLGVYPDNEDTRDLCKSLIPEKLPSSAQTSFVPKIRDQKKTNSCTGYAVSGFWEQVLRSRLAYSGEPFSSVYPWWFARVDEQRTGLDVGVSMRAIMSALNKFGDCPISKCDDDYPVDKEPTVLSRVYGNALRLPQYERCSTLYDIKYSIAKEDLSVCVGVAVFEFWYSDKVVKTGKIPVKGDFDFTLGYHAVVFCGYDDDKEWFKVANSWGTSYGDDGFIYIPYQYFDETRFDAWTASKDFLPEKI